MRTALQVDLQCLNLCGDVLASGTHRQGLEWRKRTVAAWTIDSDILYQL